MRRTLSVGFLISLAFVLMYCPSGRTSGTDLAGTLESHVRYLASDSLEGRLPGTPGIEMAADYIAGEFEAMGLEPAFGGSYFQEFEINLGFTVTAGPVMKFDGAPPVAASSIAVLPVSGSGNTGGDIVRRIPDEGDLARHVVLLGIPPEVEEERWTMMGSDGLLEYMGDEAARAEERGAAAVIFAASPESESGAGLHHFPLRRSYRQAGIPVVEVDIPVAELIRPGEGAACSLEVAVAPRTIKVKNVGGLKRGTTRADEYVVVGAHYDHLGYGDIASSTPWRREVHNGADDNASGVAALIEIARSMAKDPPRERSVVFVAFTAEELGALGSEYYCKHPPFPMEKTIGMINLDTVGRMEDMKLIVFGALSAEEMSALLAQKNTYGLDLIEKKEIYGFSDQNPFYARGIPSLHFFTGAYDDYHSPDDDPVNLNFVGLSSLTHYVFSVTRELSNIAHLTPVIDAEEPSPPEMSRGSGAFLGIVPDFAYSGTGVGLKGTVPASPAESA
ncbi:MAG: M20/M25/M40 family metallo-hydrolase, partial [bacterium]